MLNAYLYDTRQFGDQAAVSLLLNEGDLRLIRCQQNGYGGNVTNVTDLNKWMHEHTDARLLSEARKDQEGQCQNTRVCIRSDTDARVAHNACADK